MKLNYMLKVKLRCTYFNLNIILQIKNVKLINKNFVPLLYIGFLQFFINQYPICHLRFIYLFLDT